MPSDPSAHKPYQKHWKGGIISLGNEKTEKLSWEEGLKKARKCKIVSNSLQGMAKRSSGYAQSSLYI